GRWDSRIPVGDDVIDGCVLLGIVLLRNFMITDGPHPSYMDPSPAQNPSSSTPQATTQWP
ncbi:hypothetical protein ACIA8K_39535, partial [Catenuloplanes sp. NPDC051500]|uniref:hypothetical protein n=1 Tax=Catenuloplanes sp. NPDC051500 TaxID=3363959 RepID=UPI0037B0EB0F